MKHGEIIKLGRHKVMCGDSTDSEDVAALMGDEKGKMLFTSPPYSDIYEYSGNEISPEKLSEFIELYHANVEVMCVNLGLKKRNHEIITYWDEYITRAHECGLKLLSWNVWDKLNPGSIGQKQYMFPLRHEFIFVFGAKRVELNRTIPKHGRDYLRGKKLPERNKRMRERNGEMTRDHTSNHQPWERNKQLESVIVQQAVKSRPVWGFAQMPVELAEEYIKALTEEGDIVIAPFGGSGTTLMACERTGRVCRMMEINPESCEVILRRYASVS